MGQVMFCSGFWT